MSKSKKEMRGLKDLLKKHRPKLVYQHKIKKFGVGYKWQNNKLTDEVAIIAYVRAKLSASALLHYNTAPLPLEIGVRTDCIEIPVGFATRVARISDAFQNHKDMTFD